MSADGVPARILSRKLLGEIEEWNFELEGLARPLVMRTTARLDIAPGAIVKISMDPSDFIVIPTGKQPQV